MKIVKNIDVHDINLPFQGKTYRLQQNIPLAVPDEVFTFLEESFPLSFSFNQEELKAEKVKEVKTTKTKVMLPIGSQALDEDTNDMRISSPHPKDTFGFNDEIPKTPDWHGEGLEVDNV